MSGNIERKQWIDIARAYGIFAIVYGHLVQGDSVFSQFFGSFRVAIFFSVMGLTFRYEKGFAQFIKKKATRLLIPYGLFSLISILIFAFMGRFFPSLIEGISNDILGDLRGALYGNGLTGHMKWNLPLWFLPCSFVTLILVYLFESQIHRINEHKKQILRITFILGTFVLNLLYCSYLKWLKLPFGTEVAISMSGFVEIGILLAQLNKINNKALGGALGATLVVLGFLISIHNGYVSVMSLYFGNNIFVYYIVAIISIVGIFLLSVWFGSINAFVRTRRAICYCGRHTLAILCMHKFPVLLFQLVMPFTKIILRAAEDSAKKNAIGLFITIIVMGLCLIVEKPIEHFVPIALGTKRNREE